MNPLRCFVFGDVVVDVYDDHVTTTFFDDSSSSFYPPVDAPEFQAAAREFGYLDAMQFGLEHDIAHSYIAHRLGYKCSAVVWADAHASRDAQPKQIYDDEEHLVNRMLRYVNTGQVDADHGVLVQTWGHNLPLVAQDLWQKLRGNAVCTFGAA